MSGREWEESGGKAPSAAGKVVSSLAVVKSEKWKWKISGEEQIRRRRLMAVTGVSTTQGNDDDGTGAN